jgi:hypothetical protein
VFESITFGRDSLVDLTSLGELAECLLYYKKVHVIVDHGSFTRLARVCGPETLLGLIEDGHLAVTYLENRPVVATQLVAGREQHGFALGQAKGKESQSLVPELLQELTGKQVDTNIDFAMLNVEYRRINPDHNLDAALVLDLLFEGYAEVDYAASLAAELAPTPTESVIARERISSVLEASGRSVDRLSAFRSF